MVFSQHVSLSYHTRSSRCLAVRDHTGRSTATAQHAVERPRRVIAAMSLPPVLTLTNLL